MILTALIFAALTVLGALSTATFACQRHEASACGQGQVWDSATHACVPRAGT